MTQPLTIRADTPRQAVEEVCKWLEFDALRARTEDTFETIRASINALRSATIEPKEP